MIATDQDVVQNDQMDMAELMKARRAELGISQTELAASAGVNVRQIARYESGEQQPLLSVAVQLADALGISISQLAGELPHDLDLSGTWYAGWQTSREGEQWLAIQEVTAHHHGQHLQVTAERTRPVGEGGYNWTGELRLWDNEVLMGWYRGADGAVRSKGTMYFALHPHGSYATGRWVGMSYDGHVATGWSSLARNKEEAEQILNDNIERGANA